jgi:hypothetical protein
MHLAIILGLALRAFESLFILLVSLLSRDNVVISILACVISSCLCLPYRQGAQQWSPCEESDASKQRLAPEIEGLQQRASACVDQLEALAAAQQAAQSPILPAFGHLHVSLRGFFIDEDRSRQVRNVLVCYHADVIFVSFVLYTAS